MWIYVYVANVSLSKARIICCVLFLFLMHVVCLSISQGFCKYFFFKKNSFVHGNFEFVVVGQLTQHKQNCCYTAYLGKEVVKSSFELACGNSLVHKLILTA